MGSQSSFYNTDLLVDKIIGTPYELVKHVAANMALVGAVGNAIKGIDPTEPLLSKRAAKVTGAMAGLGVSVQFALPDYVAPEKIIAISISLATATGDRYFNDQRAFWAYISGSNLIVETLPTAPSALINATMSCFITMDS